MDLNASLSSSPWTLLDIIAVNKIERIQCQCKGCGQAIYAAIHMVRLSTGELQCWGSDCHAREAGYLGITSVKPLYSGFAGRRLSDEEREWLRTNRDRLIAKFESEHREKLAKIEAPKKIAETSNKTEAVNDDTVALFSKFMADTKPSAPAPVSSSVRTRVQPASVAKVDYRLYQPREPQDNEWYREIRDEKIALWLSRGVDLTRRHHYDMLIENCLRDFRSGGGNV